MESSWRRIKFRSCVYKSNYFRYPVRAVDHNKIKTDPCIVYRCFISQKRTGPHQCLPEYPHLPSFRLLPIIAPEGPDVSQASPPPPVSWLRVANSWVYVDWHALVLWVGQHLKKKKKKKIIISLCVRQPVNYSLTLGPDKGVKFIEVGGLERDMFLISDLLIIEELVLETKPSVYPVSSSHRLESSWL